MEVVHLDALFWLPGGFSEKRATELVRAEIDRKKAEAAWIVEGVFGDLADRFLDRTELLIWLDLPWEVCRESLLARGSESSKQRDPEVAETNFQELLTWAGDYWTRDGWRSHAGHEKIFTAFPRRKIRFQMRAEVSRFLEAQKAR